MRVVEIDNEMLIELVPRAFPCAGEVIGINLINEFTNLEINLISSFWYLEKNRLFINFDGSNTDFKPTNKYKMVLKIEEEIIFIGYLMLIKKNTNIQNYKPSTQTTQRFKEKIQ